MIGWTEADQLFPSTHSPRPVAQLAERLSPKQEVVGSIPAWPA
jgi:hypothetical protein